MSVGKREDSDPMRLIFVAVVLCTYYLINVDRDDHLYFSYQSK